MHQDDHVARGWSIHKIICKRTVPPDDHLQKAVPSRWSFARGRSIQMIIVVSVSIVVVVSIVVESVELGELDESGEWDEYGESGLKNINCLLAEKISGDANRPTNQ